LWTETSYALGCAVGSRRVGVLSALLVGSCPVIIDYSRSYHFALPATFVTTMALLALVRSDGCRHIGWAALFGLSLGLMPLARTMTIGFIPGIMLGAVIYVVIEKEDRNRRILILGGSFLVAALITGTWLFPNRNEVFGYLLNYGYGNHAKEYGPSASMFSLNSWVLQAQIFLSYSYLPHAMFAVAGALALLYLVVRRTVIQGWCALISIFAAKIIPLVVFVAAAVVALTSTQNKGSAFLAPFVPTALVIAVWACNRISSHRHFRRILVALVIVVALFGTIPSLDLKLARVRAVDVPILGSQILMSGSGTIQRYESQAGFRSEKPEQPISRAKGRAWIAVSRVTAKKLSQLGSARTVTAFGFRHYLYNVNTVGLEQWVNQEGWTRLVMVDPIVTKDTLAGDVGWVTNGLAAEACLLLTSDGGEAQFRPLVNQVTMADAAKQVGFEAIDNWALPDGQKVTLWRRNSPELHCAEIVKK
jgi:hypothetical protein